jgi:hypothetical protein
LSIGPNAGVPCLTRAVAAAILRIGERALTSYDTKSIVAIRCVSQRHPTSASKGAIMFNQTALPRTNPAHPLIDVAPVVDALHRGFLALGVLRPTRRFRPAASESYFDAGLVRRELHRL